jgi:hypothetical protein
MRDLAAGPLCKTETELENYAIVFLVFMMYVVTFLWDNILCCIV